MAVLKRVPLSVWLKLTFVVLIVGIVVYLISSIKTVSGPPPGQRTCFELKDIERTTSAIAISAKGNEYANPQPIRWGFIKPIQTHSRAPT